MLDIMDTLAVREVVEGQSPRRRRICELLMHGCNQREVGERLGMSRRLVTYHVACIRRDFIAAGFDYRAGRSRIHGWRREKIRHRKHMRHKRMRTAAPKVQKSPFPK